MPKKGAVELDSNDVLLGMLESNACLFLLVAQNEKRTPTLNRCRQTAQNGSRSKDFLFPAMVLV